MGIRYRALIAGIIALLTLMLLPRFSTSVEVAAQTPTPVPNGGTTGCFVPQTFAAGPSPSGSAPVAVAVDPIHHLVYAVERGTYSSIGVNNGLPTDRVSVVNETTGAVVTTIPVGNSFQGKGQGIAVDPTTQRIFVSNSDDNTISVLDGATNQVIATVPAGAGPTGVAIDPSLGLVYVSDSGASTISVLDESTLALRGSIDVGGSPGAITVDTSSHLAYAIVTTPSGIVAVNGQTLSVTSSLSLPLLYTLDAIASDPGSKIYVSDYDTGDVAIVNVSGGTPNQVGQIYGLQYPSAVGVDLTTHDFAVAEAGHNQVDVYNSAGTLQTTIPVERLPVAIGVDSTNRRAFVANAESDSLSVLNLDLNTGIGTDVLGTLDFGIALDSTGNRLYVANTGGDSVDVLDATTHQILAIWPTDPGPWAVAVDPALGQLYTLNIIGGGGGQTTLTVLSTTNGQVLARFNPGPAGNGAIAVSAQTHMVYVTAGNGLSVINGNTNQLVATVPVGQYPVGVAVDDAANRVFVANHSSGTISVVDTTSNKVINTWKPPYSNVWGVAVDPGLHQVYVSTPPVAIGDFSGVEVLDES
ncbi:MAG TPA: hypothetical protein VMW65_02830, partial [Chloroflexota bacterium]|nr:hypothetical protein [Chloroflexota bacterium]